MSPTCCFGGARRSAMCAGLLLAWFASVASAGDGERHWAFRPPVRPALPHVSDATWTRGAIDRFVRAKLERVGRSSSPEADRRTLARRVSLDLTGLPPAPVLVESFVADPHPDAYECLVDHLLATPAYGERWALWWLDAVRFADTNGYEIDRPRAIWLYRDWVIEAFNRDLPFDRFAIEQLAGDLLPGATLAQRIATGYHRNSYENEEGGHDWAQFRWEAIVDRVHTTSTVFLGLTMTCAQCHDHKYDPISQREYWEFFAFLNNVDEPFLDVPVPHVVREREARLAEIARLEAARETEFPLPDDGRSGEDRAGARARHLEARFEEWRRRAAEQARRWQQLEPLTYRSKMNATITLLADDSLLVGGDRPEIDEYRVRYRLPPGTVRSLRLEAMPHPSLPRHGPGRGSVMEDGSFALSEITVVLHAPGAAETPRPLALSSALATHHRSKRTPQKAIDGNPLTSWHTQGGVGREQRAVFSLDSPITVGDGAELEVVYLMNFVHQQTLGRFRLSVTDDGREARVPPYDAAILSALLKPADSLVEGDREALRRAFVSHAPELEDLNRRISELRAAVPQLPTTLVVEERKTKRKTSIYTRGAYGRPAEEVQPGVPAVLHALPDGRPRNRLTFALWLASPANPLTARVVSNHLWQALFGRGLVATPEDFGTQGERPSHPALLDWLATELVRRDWSLKEILRLIVTSAAYRQSSFHPGDGFDPGNRLLSRGPRHRLSAEAIRDVTLVASGLLSRQLGGPSVFPPRPDQGSGFTYSGLRWTTSEGAQRYRRGLYTHRKRGSPHPGLATLNAPPRNTCTVKRERSNTPLQALALLNDECVVEASRELAKRVLDDGTEDDRARLREAFKVCTTRLPDVAELDALLDFLRAVRTRLQSGELDASALVGDKAAAAAGGRRLEELAAWTVVARTLLNLDETITKG